MKRYCIAILLVIFVAAATAQEPSITPDMQVDSAVLAKWLHSGDPRLVAWAADFAHRKHDTSVIAQLPAWMEHAAMPPTYGGDEWARAQRRAVAAVLDTLIQENAQVPLPAIANVSHAFVAQATILISRYPLSGSLDELYKWFAWGDRTQVRVAAMMFAKNPGIVLASSHFDLTFVGGIVADSESELHITVASDSAARGGLGNTTCGDGGGYKLPEGWPQVYTYDLAENDPNANGPVVIDLDADRITAWRHTENGGWGSCSGVQRLDAYTRHQLIAYWLGVKPKDVPWQPRQDFTIQWTGQAAYEGALGKIVESQRQKLRATSDALRARGILQGLDAVPRLVIVIDCEVKPCPLK